MNPNYTYQCVVQRVIDGDTVELDIDLGFYIHAVMSCRLYGLNAREHDEPGGEAAKRHLAKLLAAYPVWNVTSVGTDKYGGRFDGVMQAGDTAPTINDLMIKAGYAAAWDGNGVKPVPPWPRKHR